MKTPQKIMPCLWFEKNAEKAARFYVSVFPNSSIDEVHRAKADTPSIPSLSKPFDIWQSSHSLIADAR